MEGNAIAAGETSVGRWEPGAEQAPADPPAADVLRIVRAVEHGMAPGQDRTRHIVVGRGIVLATGVGLVAATAVVLNDFVHTVVDELARSL